MSRSGFIKPTKTSDPVGIETRIKTVKNKVMPPFKEVIVPIIFGVGIDYYRSLFSLLKKKKIIKQAGSSYYFEYKHKGEKKRISARGQAKFIREIKDKMENNRSFKKKIMRKISEKT